MAAAVKKKKKIKGSTWQFWAIIAIPMVLILVFNYIPMLGIVIAFKDYSPRKGIFGSDWVGMKYLMQFLTSPSSVKVIRNTFILGFYQLIFSFPVPIILAIALNECRQARFKKVCADDHLCALFYFHRYPGRYPDAGNGYENRYYEPYHWAVRRRTCEFLRG